MRRLTKLKSPLKGLKPARESVWNLCRPLRPIWPFTTRTMRKFSRTNWEHLLKGWKRLRRGSRRPHGPWTTRQSRPRRNRKKSLRKWPSWKKKCSKFGRNSKLLIRDENKRYKAVRPHWIIWLNRCLLKLRNWRWGSMNLKRDTKNKPKKLNINDSNSSIFNNVYILIYLITVIGSWKWNFNCKMGVV